MTPTASETDAPIDIRRLARELPESLSADPARRAQLEEDAAWLTILHVAFGHEPVLLLAERRGEYLGHLPLALMRSRLFGRFAVSLPYINTAGVRAADHRASEPLINRAVEIAADSNARFLELRHEEPIEHAALAETLSGKVHMRLPLPETSDELMASLKSKRRSQLKNGLKRDFPVRWGKQELLDDYYRVFSQNMRDLGTPVYSKTLFREILAHLDAELCCLYDDARPVAASLLVHHHDRTEVPSASSLKRYNPTNVNMAMYWHLLTRAIERGRPTFDFGRGTVDGPTHAFKKHWGAQPSLATWQYHLRHGAIDAARPDNARFQLAIRLWKRLPLPVANTLGPRVVRGIP